MTIDKIIGTDVAPEKNENNDPQKRFGMAKSEKEKDMRRGDLSHLFRKFLGATPSSPEETTPFAKKGPPVPYSGCSSVTKSVSSTMETSEPKSVANDLPLPKMGLVRKGLFLLSLNGWILYLAVLLYFIPCRHPNCQARRNWTTKWEGELTTNLEVTGLPSSLLFGFSDEFGGHLASLATTDGMLAWNRSTKGVLRKVFCNLHPRPEIADSSVPDCIGSYYNNVEAFNSSTGTIIWQRELKDPDDETIHSVALSSDFDSGSTILGVGDEFLFVFDSKNGSILSTVALPCSWTINVRLVGPWVNSNRTQWTIACEFGDSLEVWSFEEGEVLHPPPEGGKRRADVRFSQLFSVGEGAAGGGGSIDLAGDVTRRGDSLALSWADRVVMATRQAPSHQLGKTWERLFPDSLVTSISFGYFFEPTKLELAVALKTQNGSELHILDKKNSSSKFIAPLGSTSVMSLQTLVAEKGDLDALIIESINNGKTTNSSEVGTTREYFVLKFEENAGKFKKTSITSKNAFASAVSPLSEGASNLLIASRNRDGTTTINRYVITNTNSDCTTHEKRTLHVVD